MSPAKTWTLSPWPLVARGLLQQDGHGVGLLAGRAPRRPYPDRAVRARARDDARDHRPFQGLEGRGVAEELRDADEEVAEELVALLGVVAQARHVAHHGGHLQHLHAPLDPADEGVRLVLAEVVSRPLADDGGDAPELLGRLLGGPVRGLVPAPHVCRVLQQLGGDVLRGQDVVHEARGDRAAHDGVVPGGLRGLGHGHPPVLLHRTQPEGAVGPRPREQDADGVSALVLGQGVEERVDGHAHALVRGRLPHAEHARPLW